jgi:integrase
MLGHSSIRVTADIYTDVLPELQREAADKMDAWMAGGASQ